MAVRNEYIRWFEKTGSGDVPEVGGKNASLGEMIRGLKNKGVKVPDGFATTASAYFAFLEDNNLNRQIESLLKDLETGNQTLNNAGKSIRGLILDSKFSSELSGAIGGAYKRLSKRYNTREVNVAVRSSATAEDLPEASFAGQQESFLNISGEDMLLDACRRCYASLFTDRAIS